MAQNRGRLRWVAMPAEMLKTVSFERKKAPRTRGFFFAESSRANA